MLGSAVVAVEQSIKAVRMTSRSRAVISAEKDAVGVTITAPGGGGACEPHGGEDYGSG